MYRIRNFKWLTVHNDHTIFGTVLYALRYDQFVHLDRNDIILDT